MEPTRHVGCKNVTDNTLSDLCFTIMSHKKPGRTELKFFFFSSTNAQLLISSFELTKVTFRVSLVLSLLIQNSG